MCKSSQWLRCIKLSLTTTFCFRMACAKIHSSQTEIGGWCVVFLINLDVPAQTLAPYVHLQWNHWAKDMPGRKEFNPWSFGTCFSGGKNLFDCSYNLLFMTVYCQCSMRSTRDKKTWQQSESSKENPLFFSPDFKAALQRDEISTGEPRPPNDVHGVDVC